MNSSLVVLQSFPVPRPTTNPYLVQLARGLRESAGVSVVNFSWRAALIGKYDVFHVHWPEILVSGHSPLKKLVRQLLTVALLCRLAVTRVPLVRTIHNIELPKDISSLEVLILRWIDRRTALYVRLNSLTAAPPGRASVLIPHGHYRDWFRDFPKADTKAGQIGYVGLIRRYKGLEDLIRAFRRTTNPGLSLRVGGSPSSPELGKAIAALSRGDGRICLNLCFLSDEELVHTITSSELVVLPYRFMHNSGGALAALSLDRPVLVPANEVNQALSEEVGPGWVFQFSGALTPEHILQTLASLAERGPCPRPDLSGRNWEDGALAHREAYEQAVAAGAGRARKVEKAVRP